MARPFFLLLTLCGLSLAQFEWTTAQQQHEFLKEQGFYSGDVKAAWSIASGDALKAYAARDNIAVSPDGAGRAHEATEYFRQRVGAWVLEHDIGAIKPRSVGVFFVQFNKERCGGGYTRKPECMTEPAHVDKVINRLFGERNAHSYFAMATRGLHRFLVPKAGDIHHVSLGQKDIKNTGINFGIRDEVGYSNDLAQKYNRSVYILPSDYQGWGMGTTGMADGSKAVFLKFVSAGLYMHETGHTLGLGHNGALENGRFDEYIGKSSIMSAASQGYGLNAPELDWLRVINHNILELTKSTANIKIKSLTSISDDYVVNAPYSPISGWVAAIYRSVDNGPEYYFEWREAVRQDWDLERLYRNTLLVHHVRTRRQTQVDASLALGEKWTSPRGDLTVIHTGPTVGTFEILVGPVLNPDAKISSWTQKNWLASFPQIQ